MVLVIKEDWFCLLINALFVVRIIAILFFFFFFLAVLFVGFTFSFLYLFPFKFNVTQNVFNNIKEIKLLLSIRERFC